MWAAFVELLRAGIFSAAHVCGGSLGGGILVVSALLRLGLLPLTLRLARRAREQQAQVAALRPEIDALQRRYATDPLRLMQETRALQAKHGVKLVTPSSLVGLAIQFPILGGLFSAVRNGLGAKVRFLWVGDLARPDGVLLLGVAALTAWGISTAPTTPGQTAGQTPLLVISVLGTVAFLWSASSAVALSFGAGSLVSVLQNWLLSRDVRRQAPNA
ncbi:MAG: YidC/Oxa1 family membrane protein insertase [Myxococcales bacterium]